MQAIARSRRFGPKRDRMLLRSWMRSSVAKGSQPAGLFKLVRCGPRSRGFGPAAPGDCPAPCAGAPPPVSAAKEPIELAAGLPRPRPERLDVDARSCEGRK